MLFTLLRQHRLLVPRKRRFTKTAEAQPRFRKHPNLVKKAPQPTSPDPLLVRGITCLPTRQGTVYLNLVTDAYSRKIVGAHVRTSLYTMGYLVALQQAVRRAKTPGVVLHTDRGRQFYLNA